MQEWWTFFATAIIAPTFSFSLWRFGKKLDRHEIEKRKNDELISTRLDKVESEVKRQGNMISRIYGYIFGDTGIKLDGIEGSIGGKSN